MDDFLKMDIFFFVTSVAIIAISILLGLVLIRLLRILKRVDEVSEMVQEEAQEIRADIQEMRASVKAETFRIGQLLSTLGGFLKPKRAPRKKKATSSAPTES